MYFEFLIVRMRVCIQEAIIASRRFADGRSRRCRKVYVVCADIVSGLQQFRACYIPTLVYSEKS